MRLLYQAANTVEAHMIVNLLEQEGLAARIDGEYLQGGIGDLPAFGLIRVMAAEEDFERAQQIVAQWDAAQPASEPASASAPLPVTARGRAAAFAAGLGIGLLCAIVWYRAPLQVNGIDHNHDGAYDDKTSYAAGGAALRTEVDRNLDHRIDAIYHYDAMGSIDSSETDDDFDGVFESVTTYRQGNPYLTETDTDHDGFHDLKTNYEHGVALSVEHIDPATGLALKIDFFALGRMAYSLVDSDKDGKMDRRIRYTELGDVKSVEQL